MKGVRLPLVLAPALVSLASILTAGCADDPAGITGFRLTGAGDDVTSDVAPLIVELATAPRAEADPLRVRINGQFLIADFGNGEWTYVEMGGGGGSVGFVLPAASYTVELVRRNGQVLKALGPFQLDAAPGGPGDGSWTDQATVRALFWGPDGQIGARVVNPAAQDGDPDTLEATVINAFDHTVAIDRCHRQADAADTCVSVGTVAAGAEGTFVQPLVAADPTNKQADYLVVRPEDAVTPASTFDYLNVHAVQPSCQVTAIVATGVQAFPTPTSPAPSGGIRLQGQQPTPAPVSGGTTPFAHGTCP